jgi:hypothetical protein
MHSPLTLSVLASLLALAACNENDANGYVWEVTLTGIADECNSSPQGYQETFEYILFYDGSLVDLRVDGESFAIGNAEGCNLAYSSQVMGEQRDNEAWIKWILEGETVFRPGGTSCDLEAGTDWKGTETFTIRESEDKEIPEGCVYTLDAQGTYLGKSE